MPCHQITENASHRVVNLILYRMVSFRGWKGQSRTTRYDTYMYFSQPLVYSYRCLYSSLLLTWRLISTWSHRCTTSSSGWGVSCTLPWCTIRWQSKRASTSLTQLSKSWLLNFDIMYSTEQTSVMVKSLHYECKNRAVSKKFWYLSSSNFIRITHDTLRCNASLPEVGSYRFQIIRSAEYGQ